MAQDGEGGTPPANSEPAAGTVRVHREGAAEVLLHANDVFLNEAQVTNRDLSTAVLRHFLPILQQEHNEGRFSKQRGYRHSLQAANRQVLGGQQQQALAGGSAQSGSEKQQRAEAAGQGDAAEPDASGSAGAPGSAPACDGSSDGSPKQGFRVLEGLAATGLRALRYALEVPGIARIDANDLDASVCESMRANVRHNGEQATRLVHVSHGDARVIMIKAPLTYDVIDLDPYGTPCQLLDAAVQSVADGGMLLVTATDMATLCGNNSAACWTNYGAYPLHRPYCHEQALRILLASLEMAAARYKRHIRPLLSVAVDFYVRIFVRVFTSPHEVKNTACRLSYVWQSSGCDSYWLQRVGQRKEQGKGGVKHMPAHGPAVPGMRCPDSGAQYLMGGPIWSEPIHDQGFVQGLLQSLDRDKARYKQYAKLRGMLANVHDELPDVPLYYHFHELCKTVRVSAFNFALFKSALINAGYRVSGSHTGPLTVKTDAPPTVLWDILRCWVKDNPVKLKGEEGYPAAILAKEPILLANFTRAQVASKLQDGLPRFVENPARWGPKARHGRPVTAPASKQKHQPRDTPGKGKDGWEGSPASATAAGPHGKGDAAVARDEQAEQLVG